MGESPHGEDVVLFLNSLSTFKEIPQNPTGGACQVWTSRQVSIRRCESGRQRCRAAWWPKQFSSWVSPLDFPTAEIMFELGIQI